MCLCRSGLRVRGICRPHSHPGRALRAGLRALLPVFDRLPDVRRAGRPLPYLRAGPNTPARAHLHARHGGRRRRPRLGGDGKDALLAGGDAERNRLRVQPPPHQRRRMVLGRLHRPGRACRRGARRNDVRALPGCLLGRRYRQRPLFVFRPRDRRASPGQVRRPHAPSRCQDRLRLGHRVRARRPGLLRYPRGNHHRSARGARDPRRSPRQPGRRELHPRLRRPQGQAGLAGGTGVLPRLGAGFHRNRRCAAPRAAGLRHARAAGVRPDQRLRRGRGDRDRRRRDVRIDQGEVFVEE
ncbi:MAG: hypothetical protein BWX69_01390 [Planctomycetes bacterium ADurb.Bin069]|nr:MAG: hypothetical protein BWX69_01390 [Planctomycetes bacterium ADurb.Bin069]